uniref:PH domain-containing protein n=1 Tax=Glossina austeni TaxID=7395 RepID=A0A1A9UNJ6_GLOAU
MTHFSDNSSGSIKMKINEKNLCVFATSPPYDKEGFLNKRGEVNKSFQRRYFVLKGNLLFYFEKQGDKEPLGLIIVEGCTIELSEESDRYCFEIAFNGNRTYVLSADSQESMESWMKALTCAGYEYKKLMVAELQRQLEEIEGSKNKVLTDSLKAKADVSIPKPPPRRQNPFNRPAPPPPNGNLVANPIFSFNGNQIASKQRIATDIQQDFSSVKNLRPIQFFRMKHRKCTLLHLFYYLTVIFPPVMKEQLGTYAVAALRGLSNCTSLNNSTESLNYVSDNFYGDDVIILGEDGDAEVDEFR